MATWRLEVDCDTNADGKITYISYHLYIDGERVRSHTASLSVLEAIVKRLKEDFLRR